MPVARVPGGLAEARAPCVLQGENDDVRGRRSNRRGSKLAAHDASMRNFIANKGGCSQNYFT